MDDPVSEFLDRSDDVIGGFWGNHIAYVDKDFDISKVDSIRVYGHKPADQMPKVGSKIAGEFSRSWVMFEVVKMDRKSNPPDMFFAELVAVEQVMKPGHVT